jgi:hypothetical protein
LKQIGNSFPLAVGEDGLVEAIAGAASAACRGADTHSCEKQKESRGSCVYLAADAGRVFVFVLVALVGNNVRLSTTSPRASPGTPSRAEVGDGEATDGWRDRTSVEVAAERRTEPKSMADGGGEEREVTMGKLGEDQASNWK